MHHNTSFRLLLLLPLLFFISFSQPLGTELCKPGSFLDGTECRLCPPGTYSSQPGSKKCTVCRRGTFNPNQGAPGFDLCTPCPLGTFNSLRGQSNCKPCPPGTNSTLQAVVCHACRAGLQNAPHTSLCDSCDGKSITIRPGSARCDPCPPNHVSDATGTKCVPCPPGQSVIQNMATGSKKTQHTCRLCRGYAINNGNFETCQDCPPGHGANRDRTKCVMCSAGTARLSLLKGCVKCPTGENVRVRGSSLCLPPNTACPENYFRIKQGGCLTCHKGQRFDPIIKKCIDCGKYEETDGGLDTKCRPCNLFQTGSPEGCVCRPGAEFVNNRLCRLCPAGYTTGRLGRCALCQRGTFAAKKGSAECTKCPAGRVSKANGAGCTSCSTMEVFRSSAFRRPGNEAHNVRRTVDNLANAFGVCIDPLTNCPADTVRVGSETGFGGIDGFCRPKKCPPNTIVKEFPPNDITELTTRECISCVANAFFNQTSSRCQRCPFDFISAGGTSKSCQSCKHNRMPQTRALADGRFQVRCGCFDRFALQGGKCMKCPNGLRPERVGWGDAKQCVSCPLGTGEFQGKTEIRDCRVCRPGTFAASNSTCHPCPAGSTSGFGSGACVKIGEL